MDGCQVGKTQEEIKSVQIELKSTMLQKDYQDLQVSLSTVNGIVDVDVDASRNAIFVDYHPDKISQEKIKKLAEGWSSK